MPSSTTPNGFLAALQSLGNPEALVADGPALTPHPRVNAHVHLPPNFSAFETTTQALDLAQAQGVRVLGASNYYDYSVYADFADGARARGLFPLFGLEIICLDDDLVQRGVKSNDPSNPGKMYVCGKGITRFNPLSEEAARLLQTIRDNDSMRTSAVVDKLAAVFVQAGLETGLDADAIKARVVARHGVPPETVYLQERHVAQAFQEILFERVPEAQRAALLERAFGATPKSSVTDTVGLQNEMRAQLIKSGKPAYVPETFVDFGHAYRLILALGGIPCYPVLADGASPMTPYEDPVEGLASDLKARGIPSAEFIPNRNRPEVLSRCVHALRDTGLFVTAGTEHNTLDLIPLAPACLGDAPIPNDVQEIFWEGACVIAAHQFLTLTGRAGFVDAPGTPNPAYGSADERIRAFRRIGEAVLGRYGDLAWGG